MACNLIHLQYSICGPCFHKDSSEIAAGTGITSNKSFYFDKSYLLKFPFFSRVVTSHCSEIDSGSAGNERNGTIPANSTTDGSTATQDPNSQKLIIAVTPTYVRAAQAAHFVQMVNIMRVVPPPFLWIIVESLEKTEETSLLLQRTAGSCILVGSSSECTALNYTHIASKKKHENRAQSRGVIQRNAALEYIENNQISGIVYFMDDDNVYSPQLFQEMRKIKKVGIWPVGFLWSWTEQQISNRNRRPMVERPLVRKDMARLHVIGWETFEWAAHAKPGDGRKYQTDMAGFAFHSEILWAPKNKFSGLPNHPVRFRSRSAWIETQFLERIISSLAELEPLANGCQDVLVWHTKMEARKTDPYPYNWQLPQPSGLIPDEKFTATARYVVRRRGYKLANHTGKIPFGYRDTSTPLRTLNDSELVDGSASH